MHRPVEARLLFILNLDLIFKYLSTGTYDEITSQQSYRAVIKYALKTSCLLFTYHVALKKTLLIKLHVLVENILLFSVTKVLKRDKQFRIISS